MPNFRSSITTPIGLLTGLIASAFTYITHFHILQSIVYSRYIGLISTFQLYEVAWILATLDYLLDLSNLFSLLLWVIIAITLALLLRNMNVTLTILAIGLMLPAGTWLLFAVKYAPILNFTPVVFFSFLIWQLLLPLAITLAFAGVVTLPFWVVQRRRATIVDRVRVSHFACANCGAVYRSKPLICVACGKEGTVQECPEE